MNEFVFMRPLGGEHILKAQILFSLRNYELANLLAASLQVKAMRIERHMLTERTYAYQKMQKARLGLARPMMWSSWLEPGATPQSDYLSNNLQQLRFLSEISEERESRRLQKSPHPPFES